MAKTLDPTALIPAGFILEKVICEAERWVLRVRSAARFSNCPCCGQPSTRVHSYYQRRLLDLLSSGRLVQLEITVRKFRCAVSDCKRRVFAERFTVGSIKSFSRRTERLDLIVHHLGLALDGRPSSNFAKRLMLPEQRHTAACGATARLTSKRSRTSWNLREAFSNPCRGVKKFKEKK